MFRSTFLAASMGTALLAAAGPVGAQKFPSTDIVTGECKPESHIAEGPKDIDLKDRRSRFFCDSAALTIFDSSYRHVMIQFAERGAHNGDPLAFAGVMNADGDLLSVQRVYLRPEVSKTAQDGHCELRFENKHLSWIVCGARIEEGERAIAPIVAFDAAPGQ